MTAHERDLAGLVLQLGWNPKQGLLFRREKRRVSLNAEASLAQWLHGRLFKDRQRPEGRFAHRQPGAPWFVEQLVARAEGRSYFQPGFVLTERARDGVLVANQDIRLWVADPRALRPQRPRVGQRVRVRLPCAREAAAPGFFSVVSRAGRLAEGPHLELSLNVTPEGTLEVVEALMHDALLRRVRFEAQVVNDPGAFGRPDTALISVSPPSWSRAVAWVRGFHRRRPRLFRRGMSPFTLPLAKGVGAAEAPPGAEDFGAQRCGLLARAVLASLREGSDWRLNCRAVFRAKGLDFERPWLGQLPSSWTRR